MVETLEADVAIIGGSLGGVAAALAACEMGCTVILSEETDWLGGQLSAQGVSALDEHERTETHANARYLELRRRIREHYVKRGAPRFMPDSAFNPVPLNPGNAWVSRLCFEPLVGVKVIREMLRPFERAGQLEVLLQHRPVAAKVAGEEVREVRLEAPHTHVTLRADLFLDATDLGDLLPLTHTPFVTGAESRFDTGEPHAPEKANPNEVQSFTACFAVEYCPGESHVIPEPEGYETLRDAQPYSLSLDIDTGQEKHFKMFAEGENGELPFWTYRRLLDAELVGVPNDVALINWASNDYSGLSLLEDYERAWAEAKRLSLGFLYWLQTETPRGEGDGKNKCGFPELKLRPNVMGTSDGLAKAPYVRESRRIVGLERVLEQHLTGAHDWHIPVAIGWYPLDLHPCVGNPKSSMYHPTRPFTLPLGALIPQTRTNLLAACKNVSTTHLSNGACRVHHVEWALGEAAGVVAALCVQERCTPHEVHASQRLQKRLAERFAQQNILISWT